MRLPTNLMDCLRFVRESNLLGGQRGKPMDLWKMSLIFNRESRYQKTKENINCPAGYGVDFLVIDYYKYERDVAPVLEDPLYTGMGLDEGRGGGQGLGIQHRPLEAAALI